MTARQKGRRWGRSGAEKRAAAARAKGKRGEEPSVWAAQVGGNREDSREREPLSQAKERKRARAARGGRAWAKWRQRGEDKWQSVKR